MCKRLFERFSLNLLKIDKLDNLSIDLYLIILLLANLTAFYSKKKSLTGNIILQLSTMIIIVIVGT